MKAFTLPLFSFLLLSMSSHAQTVIYGNTSNRLGILNGWEDRGSSVTFNDIGTFSAPTGGIAVSDVNGYAVSFDSPSIYSSFDLSDPSVITHSAATTGNGLDSLVYDPVSGIVYSHSDFGSMHSFASDGTETNYGILSGLGVGGSPVEWGSHGDLAIAPDSNNMYQIGFDLALGNETSENWHSLLLIDISGDLTSATRIAQVPYYLRAHMGPRV